MLGWYLLPKSGQPFHGPVPDGAVLCEEPVDGTQGGDSVGPGVLVDEQPSQTAKVRRRPSGGVTGEEQADSEHDIGGQDPGA